jgi:hypothetical protein
MYIPKKIKIGLQNREGCYTKKLAYVIPFDEKTKKWRKEPSWEGWRDKKIDPIEFDNDPTEGFVINKGIQRYSDWNGGGRAMVRVYDSRDFEFEITLPNLEFILTECDCSKGKGFEGRFVYAWDGKDLILTPITSQEYKDCFKDMEFKNMKLKKKDFIEGHTYKNIDREEYIYLGVFDYYPSNRNSNPFYYFRYFDSHYNAKNGNCVFFSTGQPTKTHVFVFKEPITSQECIEARYKDLTDFSPDMEYSNYASNYLFIPTTTSLNTKFKQNTSNECHPEYAEFCDTLKKHKLFGQFSHFEFVNIKKMTKEAEGLSSNESFFIFEPISNSNVLYNAFHITSNYNSKNKEDRFRVSNIFKFSFDTDGKCSVEKSKIQCPNNYFVSSSFFVGKKIPFVCYTNGFKGQVEKIELYNHAEKSIINRFETENQDNKKEQE